MTLPACGPAECRTEASWFMRERGDACGDHVECLLFVLPLTGMVEQELA